MVDEEGVADPHPHGVRGVPAGVRGQVRPGGVAEVPDPADGRVSGVARDLGGEHCERVVPDGLSIAMPVPEHDPVRCVVGERDVLVPQEAEDRTPAGPGP
jgi:hypothetical protein